MTDIHDWQNPEAIAICHQCREAMVPHGEAFVVEMVIPPEESQRVLMDRQVC